MSQLTLKDLKKSIRDYKQKMCPAYSNKKRGELEGIVNRLGLNPKPTGKPFGRKRAVKEAVKMAKKNNPALKTKTDRAVDNAVAMARKRLGL
jgi:hypothetical protein